MGCGGRRGRTAAETEIVHEGFAESGLIGLDDHSESMNLLSIGDGGLISIYKPVGCGKIESELVASIIKSSGLRFVPSPAGASAQRDGHARRLSGFP